jgi:hypothetical protein
MGSAMARLGIPAGVDTYSAALEGLTETNQVILSRGGLPPLYKAGVKYRLLPHNTWRTADEVGMAG